MPYFSYLKDNDGIQDVMRLDRDRYGPLSRTVQNIMRSESQLSVADRELLGAYVSGLNQCQFCHNSHVAFAEGHGIDPAVFGPLLKDVELAPVEARLKPVLNFAQKLTLAPYKITRQDYDATRNAGWSERALSDAVAVVALFNFFNRIVEGHGIRAPSAEDLRRNADIMINAGYSVRAIVAYVIKRRIKRSFGRLGDLLQRNIG